VTVKDVTAMEDSTKNRRSFAEVALAGEDERRHAEAFPRPARTRFKRHAVLFVVVNVMLALANVVLVPGHLIFYYLTIVWAAVLADNFLWAYVVDPDRDVAERDALKADRQRRRALMQDGQMADETTEASPPPK